MVYVRIRAGNSHHAVRSRLTGDRFAVSSRRGSVGDTGVRYGGTSAPHSGQEQVCTATLGGMFLTGASTVADQKCRAPPG